MNNQKQNKPQQTTTNNNKKKQKKKHNKPTALCKEKTLKELDPTSKIQTKFREVFIGSRPTSIQPSHPTSAGCASHFGHGPKTRQSWRCASTTGHASRNLGKKLCHPGDQNSIKPPWLKGKSSSNHHLQGQAVQLLVFVGEFFWAKAVPKCTSAIAKGLIGGLPSSITIFG